MRAIDVFIGGRCKEPPMKPDDNESKLVALDGHGRVLRPGNEIEVRLAIKTILLFIREGILIMLWRFFIWRF
jgi:hypothetical protein